jgi:redox-sensing transcriptional repressor
MVKKRSKRKASLAGGNEPRLSRASVGRFSLYLRHLEQFHREGVHTVSSGQLGEALGITGDQVRKDLAYLGNLGHPGIGYASQDLINALRRKLGINREWKVAMVGIGNLARALLRYRGFQEQGFRIVALFDTDRSKVGHELEGLLVQPPEAMPKVVAETGAELGLLTVPSEAAQGVADALVAAGVRGLLNFAPVVVRVPSRISLVAVDLAIQLEQLAFLVHLTGNE